MVIKSVALVIFLLIPSFHLFADGQEVCQESMSEAVVNELQEPRFMTAP